MAGILHTAANVVRDIASSPEEHEGRARAKQIVALIKLATVVSVAVATLFFAVFPNVFTAIVLALTGYSAYEVFNIANNMKEIVDNALVEASFRASTEYARNHTLKGAPVIRMIFEIIAP